MMTSPPPLPVAKPTQPQNRILSLDVLRGIALLGILLVNIHEFSFPALFASITGVYGDGSWNIDTLTLILTGTFLGGKWIIMYSFLFGVGIQLTAERLSSKGFSPGLIIFKRLGILLLFGLLHITLFWFGDILVMYSLLGCIVLLMWKASAKATLLTAILLSACLFIVYLMLSGLATLGELLDSGSSQLDESSWFYQQYQRCLHTYAHGSWLEILRLRWVDTLLAWLFTLLWAPQSLAVMLAGAWAVKSGKLPGNPDHPDSDSASSLRRWIIPAGLLALPVAALMPLAEFEILESPHLSNLLFPLILIIDPLLSLSYGIIIFALVECFRSAAIWQWIAAAGRMPLTNYLLQSAIATTFFYAYGTGWYGKVGAFSTFLFALALYGSQLLFSRWWMSHHRYGPLENLWRRGTYGNLNRK